MNNEIKFDHFKNLEELKQNVENWLATDEMYWERWFGLRDIKTLLDIITNLDEKYKKSCETYQQALDETMSQKMDLEQENEKLRENYKILKELQMKTNEENERLLHIAKKMHTYIFLNTDNEQEVYDKLGLTEEENIMLGYSGQIIIKSGDDNAINSK